MAAAVAIAAGAAALGGLVQLYNAEKQRGVDKRRLDEIEKLFNSIKPPDYDLTIIDPPDAHARLLELPQFSSPQAAPKFDLSKLNPKQLEQVGEFIPNVAPLILEQEPELLKKSEAMRESLEAQQIALNRFMDIGEGGYDPQLQQNIETARSRAQAEAQSRGESIAQDFARRGMGGSGMELAAKIGSSAEAMDRNAMMGLQAETAAYQNQLNALAQGARLGGQIWNQELGLESRNADIINAFNQRMSRRHQDWENRRADMLNQADLRNLQEAQRIADYNTGLQNQAQADDRGRLDNITRYRAQFGQQERDRQDALAKWRYAQQGQERAYQDQRDIVNRQWRQGNIDRRNNIAQQRFADKYRIAQGKAGIASDQIKMGRQRTSDRNAAIQGLANLGMNYAMYDDQRKFRDRLYGDGQNQRYSQRGQDQYWMDNYNPYSDTQWS